MGEIYGNFAKCFKGNVRSNFYHIFFLANLKVFFLTITKIYILSVFVFLFPKYSPLKLFYCCHGCKICDVKIALFSKCLIVGVHIFHLILQAAVQRVLKIMKVSLGCTSVSVSPVVRKSKENLSLPLSR